MGESTESNPDIEPHISEDPKGDTSYRIDASKEPSEDEEKRRVVENLRDRERNS